MNTLTETATTALEAAGLPRYVDHETSGVILGSAVREIDTDGWRVRASAFKDGREFVRVSVGFDAPADAVVAALESAGLTVNRSTENGGYVRATL